MPATPAMCMDAATGLTYMQQRYYDPRHREVPVGRSCHCGHGHRRELQPLLVRQNNPYKFKDPDGRIIDTVLDVGFIIYDVYKIARTGATATNVAAWGRT